MFRFGMYYVSASTFTLDRYRRDPSLGLGIGETLHLDRVLARPFTLDRYRQDPSLGLGIGETLHLDRMSASFGLLIGSLGSDDKFRE
ncbi:unnamed protein product [Rhizophagus irregularis]|nr:unnamed protein product [Rhizophagus irregularis]